MAIQLPNYKPPYSDTPITAIGWMSFLGVDFSTAEGTGRVVINVNADAGAAASYLPPINQVSVSLGQSFDTGEKDGAGKPVMVSFPNLTQIITDNAAAFTALKTYLYGKLLALPQFAGASVVGESVAKPKTDPPKVEAAVKQEEHKQEEHKQEEHKV